MASPAQIAANRKNAAKSTGPKTPKGKRIASQNAVTHGLTADRVILDTEDRTAFCALRAQMFADLAPVGAVEEMLAGRIVALTWRLRRAEKMEAAVLNVLADKGDAVERIDERQYNRRLMPYQHRELKQTLQWALSKNSPRKFSAAVTKLAALIAPNTGADADTVLGCVAIEDFRDSNILERTLRYQHQLERSLYKALTELQKRQQARKRNPGQRKLPQGGFQPAQKPE